VKPIKEWKEWKEPKEFKEYKELKEIEPKIYLEPKVAMEPKVFEGVDLIAQYQWQIDELRERFERLEDVINKLEPFITKEERPSLKPKPRAKRKT
jgi:FtsZ-binding cell division protein ZapB